MSIKEAVRYAVIERVLVNPTQGTSLLWSEGDISTLG